MPASQQRPAKFPIRDRNALPERRRGTGRPRSRHPLAQKRLYKRQPLSVECALKTDFLKLLIGGSWEQLEPRGERSFAGGAGRGGRRNGSKRTNLTIAVAGPLNG